MRNALAPSAKAECEIAGHERIVTTGNPYSYIEAEGTHLLVMRVNGRFNDAGNVDIDFVPYVYVASDTTVINPAIRAAA